MESWAHAAARRRQSNEQDSGVDSSSLDSSFSSPISSVVSDFDFIPRDREPAMSEFTNGTIEMLRGTLPKGRMPHVCIVGAGMTGLRCAEVLKKKGIKVTMLEGRNRIGGRLHQSNHLGHLVDMGPNWIHGTDNNPILDLALETSTATMAPPDDSAPFVYDEEGRRIDSRDAKNWVGLVWDTVEEATQYSKEKGDSIPPDVSLMDYFETRMKERNLGQPATKHVLQIARVWGDIVGEPIEKQSLRYFWLEECVGGENLFVAATYKAILDLVAKMALPDINLHFNTKVTKITTSKAGDAISVNAANGWMETFDEVIFTAPLGWLKRNLHAFDPPLPTILVKAIQHISYGRLEKVYITFPEAFWLDETLDPNASQTFQAQFLSPTYATSTNPSKWSIEFVSLAALPAAQAQPTILFYINGPCAQYVTSLQEKASSQSPPSNADDLIIDFFKPYFSRLPNYHPTRPKCQPTKVLATNWINDELAGNGSYTNFQVSDPAGEEIELDKDIVALRRGCPDRRLWFAGEHTAPFVALGTVTGAYWSGEAVARMVGDVYGLNEE